MLAPIKACAVVVFGLLAVFGAAPAGAQMPPPADSVFSLAARRGDAGALALSWTVAPGNYLYRDSLQATLNDAALPLATPPGDEKDDPNFGQVEIYRAGVEATLGGLPAAGRLTVTYQGCAEKGLCYPPLTKTIDLATLAVTDASPALGDAVALDQPPALDTPPALPSEAATPTDSHTALFAGNPALLLAAFFGFGLLLALTPCIFPMIPILSAMLANAGERLSARRGFALSASYVLAMAAAYAAVGLAAGWTGANLQAALQTPWALGVAAALFVALALSMFGLYDLALPTWLYAWMPDRRDRAGSIAGAAVLGFGSALVVGPCVTPPLAAALLYAVHTGEAGKGAAALFALGLGMGLPLIVAGTFGAGLLPKAGPWLEQVKRIFGFVLLGVAAMLVSRLLPDAVSLVLWGVLALGVAVVLAGFGRPDAMPARTVRLSRAAGLLAALYGVVLLVGAAGGAGDPLRPLAFLTAGADEATVARPLTRVTSPDAFDRALAASARSSRLVLVSFTAAWCTVCRTNEVVLTDPAIRRRIEALPMIAADLTAYGKDAKALADRFSVVGPPTLFLVDASGREFPGSRLIGPVTVDDISKFLNKAGV